MAREVGGKDIGGGTPLRGVRSSPAPAKADRRRRRRPEFRPAGNWPPVSCFPSRGRAGYRLRLLRELLRADRQSRALRRVSFPPRRIPPPPSTPPPPAAPPRLHPPPRP